MLNIERSTFAKRYALYGVRFQLIIAPLRRAKTRLAGKRYAQYFIRTL